MSYKKRTNFYRIPVMGKGDKMTEENNMQQWTILDNLLYASTFGCDKCFLQDGDYQLECNEDHYKLTIKPMYNNGFSLLGIINYRLFYSKKDLVVNNLYFNQRYYIYLQAHDSIQTNPMGFHLNQYTTKQSSLNSNLLLCIIETTDQPVIITDVNKVFAKNLIAHTKDNTNPHGKQMYQYDLNIINQLKLKNEFVYPSIYTSYETQSNEYILPFPQNKQVIYVTAYPESLKAGYIAWRIEDKKIFLSNAGQSGIKVNLKLDVR